MALAQPDDYESHDKLGPAELVASGQTSSADHDSTTVALYKQIGAVFFGKATTPEMGLAASTETTLARETHNPWNMTRTSGPSSGGAAAPEPTA